MKIKKKVIQDLSIEEEIKKNANKQPVSNCEAAFFMFLGYKEHLEERQRAFTQSPITPVFQDFLDYLNNFPSLNLNQQMDIDELNQVLNEQKEVLKNKRNELQTVSKVKEEEIVLLINLRPKTANEAISWIPTLKRKINKGEAKHVNMAIDIIDKYTYTDFRN